MVIIQRVWTSANRKLWGHNDRPGRGGVMELLCIGLILVSLGVFGQLKGDVEWASAVVVVGCTINIVTFGGMMARGIKEKNDRP